MKFKILVIIVLMSISYYFGTQHGRDATLYSANHKVMRATETTQKLAREIEKLQTEIAEFQVYYEEADKDYAIAVMASVEPERAFGEGFRSAPFVISAYSPFDDRNGINSDGNPNKTSTGAKPGPGLFAVDPKMIPYGSNIVIIYPDGSIERGVAADTGGAIKEHRIDVFRYTFNEAMQFGMREAVVIWY